MENKFDPKAKVKQGDLGSAPDGKQPNQEATNIDFEKHAPTKGNSKNYLDLEKSGEYLTKSGKTPSHEWAGHHWDTYFGKQFGTGPSYKNSWMSPVEAYLADPEMLSLQL